MEARIILLLLAVFCCGSFAQEIQPLTPANDTTQKFAYSTTADFWTQIDDIFEDPNFSNAHWGVVIQSLTTGEYLYKRNENKLFMPASNMKLFTTGAGLLVLGEEYRFSTNISYIGELDGSVLKGDLIIHGRGDPTISGRFNDNNLLKIYNDWADSLEEFGIDEIRGNIIGYDNDFDDVGLGSGWAWDYESSWFAAPSGALSFNDNCVDISVVLDNKSNKPKIITNPPTKYFIIIDKVLPVSKDSMSRVNVYRERGTNVITVYGTIRQGDSVKTYCSVNNPTQYSMVILKEVLEKRGITIKGYAVDVDDLPVPVNIERGMPIFIHYSPPLKDILKVINKSSQNFFAEQLLKVIGLEKYGFGSIDNGVMASQEKFKEMGINPENMVYADGSGLSRLNLVSPKQIVSLLSYFYKNDKTLTFYNSLPIAGVDGSIGNRMKDGRTKNNIRAKTGYIGGVRSLSGYAMTGDNEPIAFSLIVNNFNVPVKLAENIQDLVCLRLANCRRK
jgi:serine-type D-Ala-D-Ala carboxypeptidase/endopeptidase (penicillin-binding protein 4)